MRYAFIKSGIIENLVELDSDMVATLTASGYCDAIVQTDLGGVGDPWPLPVAPAAAALPTLAITSITSSNPTATHIASMSDVTCPAGTTLAAQVAIHDAMGSVVPLTASFRMPLKARDGRERVLLVSLADGAGTVIAPIQESGVWQVTADMLNEALQPSEQMAFAGITIYATL